MEKKAKPVTAIVYNTGWYIYNFRRRLIAELQARGHEVFVICPDDSYVEKLRTLGVQYIPLRLNPLGTSPFEEFVTLASLFVKLAKLGPDYVLSFTIKCNLYVGLCRTFLRFTQIANVSGLGQAFEHDNLLQRIACRLYKIALRGCSRVFFQNQEDFKICTGRRLIPFAASRILPGSGVDLDLYRPSDRPIGSEPRRFLIFGRLLPRKGYYEFLEAARVLKRQFGDTVEFWVLGAEDPKRPDSVELRQRIENAHAEGDILFFPFTDDVRPILSAVDVVVLPSTYNEGVPRSLLEGLACGKPVITTDWRGCRETVRNGVNGYLVPPGNSMRLIEAMETLYLSSPSRLRQMGMMSRRIAEACFDEKLVINSYLRELSAPGVA